MWFNRMNLGTWNGHFYLKSCPSVLHGLCLTPTLELCHFLNILSELMYTCQCRIWCFMYVSVLHKNNWFWICKDRIQTKALTRTKNKKISYFEFARTKSGQKHLQRTKNQKNAIFVGTKIIIFLSMTKIIFKSQV